MRKLLKQGLAIILCFTMLSGFFAAGIASISAEAASTVYFYSDGVLIDTAEVDDNGNFEYPELEKLGYNFLGWSIEGNNYYAIWEVANNATAYFYLDDAHEELYATAEIDDNGNFEYPTVNPVLEGRTFAEWDDDGNNCYVAIWYLNMYVITFFDAQGEEIYCPICQDYGTEVYLPSYIAPDGYDFIGWCDEEGNIYSDNFPMPAKELNLYATCIDSTQPITYYGKLEGYETTIVMNGSGVYVSEITVDGKTYDVDGDFIAEDDIKEHIGKDVVFSVKKNKVIWFDVVKNLKTSVSADIYSVGKLYYSGEKYDKEKLMVTVSICNNLKEEKANAAGLKGLDELKAYVSTVTVKTSNDDLLSFDGKDEFEVSVNQYIPIGGSHKIELSLDVDSGYKIADTVEKEYVSITGEMTGTQNGKDVNKSCFMSVTVENRNYSKPTNKKNQTSSSGTSSQISAQSQKAAQELSKISGAAAVGPMGTNLTLSEIFTSQQLDAIGDMLLYEIAILSAPKKDFSEVLGTSLVNELFQFDTKFFSVTSDSVSVTLSVNSKSGGEITIKFICDFNEYMGSGMYRGDIRYEILGGTGVNKLPVTARIMSGDAGGLSAVNLNKFSDAACELALMQLQDSNNMIWGDNLNEAVNVIFNKTIVKILNQCSHTSASGLTWKMLTIPGKSIKIKCPVDVYVYNSNNELVASVENNEPTLENDLVEIIINGDEKEVILFDDSYYLVYEARAEGAMNITVTEYGSSEGALMTASIENVPLSVGTTYTQNIDMKYLEESDYSLTADDESIYAVTSAELLLHDHISDGEWFEGEASTCSEHGYDYTMCSICFEWYCEYYDLLEHSDRNDDDYCDSCGFCFNIGEIRFLISIPDSRTINYGEPVKLNTNAKNLPSGAKIKWVVEGDGVKLNPSSSGRSCKVTATSTGNVVISAYVVDRNGNIITDENGKIISDSEYFYSEANLWLRIVYFFKKLFGISMNTVQLFKGVN